VQAIEAEHGGLPALDISQLQGPDPKLPLIRKWLQSNGISSEATKAALDKIKEALFVDLKPSQIEDKYFDLLAELAKRQKAASKAKG
jgi:hypothetical protein